MRDDTEDQLQRIAMRVLATTINDDPEWYADVLASHTGHPYVRAVHGTDVYSVYNLTSWEHLRDQHQKPRSDGASEQEPDNSQALVMMRHVAALVLQYTEVTRLHNGRGRSTTYAQNVDAIAGAARQLAQMVTDYLDAQQGG